MHLLRGVTNNSSTSIHAMVDEVEESLKEISPRVNSCAVISREKYGKVVISVETIERNKYTIDYSPQHGYTTVISSLDY